VLGEEEYADLREAAPDLVGGDEAFVGPGGGHADVDYRDVGLVLGDYGEQCVGGAGLGGDLDACVSEDAGESLAEDGGVVGEDYAHGIAAWRCVPRPGGLSSGSWPLRAWTRSARPRSPEPRAVSAPPMPSSSTSITTSPLLSATLTEVGRRLGWAGEAPLGQGSDRHRCG
jgi:hypothetical protein